MLTDVLDRARAKCGSRDRECFGGDREAARWHARLQLTLRWHGLEGQLNQARMGRVSQSATTRLGMPKVACARTHSVVHPRVVSQELRRIFGLGRDASAPLPASISTLLLPTAMRA